MSFRFRNNKILSITIKKGNNRITIKDSQAVFNDNLRHLAESYECEYSKSYFPYKFSRDVNLFYTGVTPTINDFIDIPKEDYVKMYSESWSFQEETLKYLELDLKVLYEVLSKANKNLFIYYNIDFTKSLTISGVSLQFFLNKYYKNNIPLINKKSMFSDIRQAYYGGITEVYRPYGENLYYYDVNSLYPFAGLNDMPGLSCNKVLVYTNPDLDKLFGFFFCYIDATNVKCEYLGLLPFRQDKLIFPLGKWEGWYFSEKLKFAKEQGYKITVIKGYEFERTKNVFNEFVKDVYKHKVNASNHTKKSIAKSLLNNLLGRWGIDLLKDEVTIISDEKFTEMLHIRDVKQHHIIGNYNLVSYCAGLNY